MKGHNLLNVVRFEVVRTLRKPIFWLVTLGVPVLFAALAALSALSSLSAPSSIEEASRATESFTYLDESGLIDPAVAADRGGRPVTDAAAAQQDVRNGSERMFVHYPRDPLTQPTMVYGQDLGMINNSAYADVADGVLVKSASAQIGDPRLSELVAAGGRIDTVTYSDGRQSGGVREFLPPLAFLVLFFLTVTMLGGQMLNITVEEKENRVTEMILTTIGPSTLITGKAVGVVLIGMVQAAIFVLPTMIVGVVALLLGAGNAFVLSPQRLLTGVVLYLLGFLMFTGLLICLGSVMPSAKEAGGAFAAVMITMFLPLYAVAMIMSSPHSLVSQVLTYFPLTAPITSMLRNAAGSLSWWETGIVMVVIGGTAVLLLKLGARLFATGSLAYDRKLNPLSVLRRSR